MMKKLLIILMISYCSHAQGQVNLNIPLKLNIGCTKNEFKKKVESSSCGVNNSKQNVKIGASFGLFNQYNLSEITYIGCPELGNIRAGSISGFFAKDTLVALALLFTSENTYDEIKEILVNKYGNPASENSENWKFGGVVVVGVWKIDGLQMRLFVNAAEPKSMPILEYSNLNLLKKAKAAADAKNAEAF